MPPVCDVCDRRDEAAGLRTVRFGDHAPLPAGVVGHPVGLHWLCEEHAAALAPYTQLSWAEARARLDAPTGGGVIDLQWPDGDGTSGVHTHEGDLLWWTRPGGDGGRFGEAARSQSLDDYRANGPAVSCPPGIEATLDAMLNR